MSPVPECLFPLPQSATSVGGSAAPMGMPFAMHARRKGEDTWSVIAHLQHLDDAKAALWAVVFTSQYAQVKVREHNSDTAVAEWPEGIAPLAVARLGLR